MYVNASPCVCVCAHVCVYIHIHMVSPMHLNSRWQCFLQFPESPCRDTFGTVEVVSGGSTIVPDPCSFVWFKYSLSLA